MVLIFGVTTISSLFELLEEHIDDKQSVIYFYDLVLLKIRFSKLAENINHGVLERSSISVEEAKLNKELLRIIDSTPEELFKEREERLRKEQEVKERKEREERLRKEQEARDSEWEFFKNLTNWCNWVLNFVEKICLDLIDIVSIETVK